MHSQRLSEKPLVPWIIAEPNGKVKSGHCICMAGLDEVCTHVAALMFWIDIRVKILQSKTVTQEKSYWLIPKSFDNAIPKEASEIDFTSASKKKAKLDEILESEASTSSSGTTKKLDKKSPAKRPSEEELKKFHNALSQCKKKSIILSVLPGHCEDFKPKALNKEFPGVLSELYKPEFENLNFVDLLDKS